MVPRISNSTGSIILLILLSISIMFLCTGCENCCYCTTTCYCENGDYTFDPNEQQPGDIKCDNADQCKFRCDFQKLGEYKGYDLNNYECYKSSCGSKSAALVLGIDEQKNETLLRFRDEVLSKSESGRKLIVLFSEHQEELSKLIEDHPALQKPTRVWIDLIMPLMERILNN